MSKYIFVCGGVISGVGKGTATASMALLLKARGFRVTAVKIDQYLNVDAGTIRPTEHGEVFVTDDGMETGSIYLTVIQKERNFEYDCEDVEVIPHIPEEIVRRIKRAAHQTKSDFVFIEIGGGGGGNPKLGFFGTGR